MSSINFDNVYLLLLAIPLIAVFVIPFALAVKKENRNRHNVASVIMHVLLSVIVAFAAAGTNIRTVLTETEVYVVADVSYSAHRNLDKIDGYIKNLKLPENSKLGLVCFGKDCELLNEAGDRRKIKSVTESSVDDSETDITGALEYTGELFTSDVIKRIVLITDGRSTDESDSYALRNKVAELRARNIKVDAIYLNDNLIEGDREIQITNVDCTATAYLGHEEVATVTVRSNVSANAFVGIRELDESRRAVELSEGTNLVSFELPTDEEGIFRYTAYVEPVDPAADSTPGNNEFLFTQNVSSEVKVLFITENFETVKAAVDRYKDISLDVYENDVNESNANKTAFINNHPNTDKLTIHRDETEIPFSEFDLCEYDEIILADANIMKFKNALSFTTNLRSVISTFGKSFLAVGDVGLQDYEEPTEDDSADRKNEKQALKAIGDLVPLRYGNSEEDPKLYTIVLDMSRSMLQNFHTRMAKDAAKKLIGLLNDNDVVCVIAFWGENMTVQPPIAAVNYDDVYKIIDNLELQQGTVISGALENAQKLINSFDYSEKQVMLITDGVAFTPSGGSDPNQALIDLVTNMYADDRIVTSVIDVDRIGNSESDSYAQFLKNVAAAGHGVYFSTANKENLDDLDFGEVTDSVTQSKVENKNTAVNIERARDEVLDDIGTQGFPDVNGYFYTTAKVGSTTVLSIDHEKASGAISRRPLYAYAKVGNGTAAAFASSFCGDWMAEWAAANIDELFFKNVQSTIVPEEKNPTPFTVGLTREGTVTRVDITPADMSRAGNVDISATLTLPSGEIVPIDLIQGPYSYIGTFDTAALGTYGVHVSYTFEKSTFEADRSLSISYAPEYDAFATYDPADLHVAIDEGGVVSIDGTLELTNDENDLSTYTVRLATALLIAAVALFVVDIIVRKLKWEDIKSFFGIGKKKREVKRE